MKIKKTVVTVDKDQLELFMQVAFALGQISQTGAKASRPDKILGILNCIKDTPAYVGWARPLHKALHADKEYITVCCIEKNEHRKRIATN